MLRLEQLAPELVADAQMAGEMSDALRRFGIGKRREEESIGRASPVASHLIVSPLQPSGGQ
jgi:hypothetical protein